MSEQTRELDAWAEALVHGTGAGPVAGVVAGLRRAACGQPPAPSAALLGALATLARSDDAAHTAAATGTALPPDRVAVLLATLPPSELARRYRVGRAVTAAVIAGGVTVGLTGVAAAHDALPEPAQSVVQTVVDLGPFGLDHRPPPPLPSSTVDRPGAAGAPPSLGSTAPMRSRALAGLLPTASRRGPGRPGGASGPGRAGNVAVLRASHAPAESEPTPGRHRRRTPDHERGLHSDAAAALMQAVHPDRPAHAGPAAVPHDHRHPRPGRHQDGNGHRNGHGTSHDKSHDKSHSDHRHGAGGKHRADAHGGAHRDSHGHDFAAPIHQPRHGKASPPPRHALAHHDG